MLPFESHFFVVQGMGFYLFHTEISSVDSTRRPTVNLFVNMQSSGPHHPRDEQSDEDNENKYTRNDDT